MKAMLVAIATIGLAGCTTHPNVDVGKAGATNSLAREDEIAEEHEIIRSSCEELWPGDWAAIAFCVERQTQGLRDVQRIVEAHNIREGDTTPQATILGKCAREWGSSRYGSADWTAVAFCFERQWDGYRRLNPLE